MLSLRVNGLIYQRMEAFIETVHHASPFLFSFRHFIELFLHIRCKKLKSMISGKYSIRKSFTTIPVSVGNNLAFSFPVISVLVVSVILPPFRFQDIIRAFYTFTVSFFYITALLHS